MKFRITALAGAIATLATFPDSPSFISERYIALIVVSPAAVAGLGMREWRRRAGDSIFPSSGTGSIGAARHTSRRAASCLPTAWRG